MLLCVLVGCTCHSGFVCFIFQEIDTQVAFLRSGCTDMAIQSNSNSRDRKIAFQRTSVFSHNARCWARPFMWAKGTKPRKRVYFSDLGWLDLTFVPARARFSRKTPGIETHVKAIFHKRLECKTQCTTFQKGHDEQNVWPVCNHRIYIHFEPASFRGKYVNEQTSDLFLI